MNSYEQSREEGFHTTLNSVLRGREKASDFYTGNWRNVSQILRAHLAGLQDTNCKGFAVMSRLLERIGERFWSQGCKSNRVFWGNICWNDEVDTHPSTPASCYLSTTYQKVSTCMTYHAHHHPTRLLFPIRKSVLKMGLLQSKPRW